MAAKAGTKVVVQAISGNGFITVIKFVGWLFSQSPSMLAEAIHSLADTLNQILLLIGLKHSTGKRSKDYSTGTGSARYVWNLVSAVGVFFLGFGVTFYHGMHSLFSPSHGVSFSWITIIVLLIAFVIELWVFIQAYKEVNRMRGKMGFIDFFKESDDPTIIAVLLEDGVAVLGVTLAFIGIICAQIFDSTIFDSIVAIIISFLMAFLAISLGIVNGKLLLGKSIGEVQESEIKKYIEALPSIDRVSALSTKIIGAGRLRLSLEVELHAAALLDVQMIKKDVLAIESGEDTYKVLSKASTRMIRIAGEHINQLETDIKLKFPLIDIIDFELN